MIGRKLVVQGEELERHAVLKDQYLEEWKNSIIKTSKKYSYLGLVVVVRWYVHSISFLKRSYAKVAISVKYVLDKKLKKKVGEKREVSGFLKMVSDYKRKIRRIKHQIKEEEENL